MDRSQETCTIASEEQGNWRLQGRVEGAHRASGWIAGWCWLMTGDEACIVTQGNAKLSTASVKTRYARTPADHLRPTDANSRTNDRTTIVKDRSSESTAAGPASMQRTGASSGAEDVTFWKHQCLVAEAIRQLQHEDDMCGC